MAKQDEAKVRIEPHGAVPGVHGGSSFAVLVFGIHAATFDRKRDAERYAASVRRGLVRKEAK